MIFFFLLTDIRLSFILKDSDIPLPSWLEDDLFSISFHIFCTTALKHYVYSLICASATPFAIFWIVLICCTTYILF